MRVSISLLIISIVIATGCNKSNYHEYQGYIEGDNIYLASPFGGTLIKMLVARGEKVKKGDLLFILDPKPEQLLLDQQMSLYSEGKSILIDLTKPKRPPEIDAVKAKILQTDAQIALAAIRVNRNEILYTKHVMDKDTLDAAVERLNELKAVKDQFQADLKLASLGARADQIIAQEAHIGALKAKANELDWETSQKKLFAPTDGVIFDTYYREGEYVIATQPVGSLLAPKNIYIEFFVPLQELNNLHVGKQITFSYRAEKASSNAVISYISPEAEYIPPLIYSRDNDNKIVFRIKANVKNCQYLIPGEPVTVSIEPDHAPA